VVLGDERDGLVVDDGLDDLEQRLRDDVADLLHVPPAHQGRQVAAHAFHLIVVRTAHQIHEVGIGAA
jgi:hypothetical protein